MKHFIAVCAKAGQRVELVVQYPTLEIARDELHRQGYSIMEIHETESTENNGGVFLFEILVNSEKRMGKSNPMIYLKHILNSSTIFIMKYLVFIQKEILQKKTNHLLLKK